MTTAEGGRAADAVLDPAKKKGIILILYFAAFATMLGIGTIAPALPLYAHLMGASGFWIGIIFSSFSLSRTLFLPIFGKLSDQHGRRMLLLIGLSGYAIFSALYVMADSVFTLSLFRFLHGMAASMVFPVAVAYVADIATVGEEGQLMGGFNSAAFLGMSFGPLLSGVLMDYIGISSAFLALALISIVTAGVCLVSLPDYRIRPRQPTPLLEVFRHPALRIPIFFYLVYSVAYITFLIYLPIITRTMGQFSGIEIGALLFIGTVTMACVQKISGRIADTLNKYLLLAAGISVIAVSCMLIAFAGSFFEYLGAVVLLGCGFGISLTTVSALVAIAGRETGQGSAAGVVNMAQGIGFIIVPAIFGIVMDYSGVRNVFIITAVVALAAAPFLLSAGRNALSPLPQKITVPAVNKRPQA
jgi:DHA1 family multidrug resistance protein-like MFS transporter